MQTAYNKNKFLITLENLLIDGSLQKPFFMNLFLNKHVYMKLFINNCGKKSIWSYIQVLINKHLEYKLHFRNTKKNQN